MHYFFRPIRMLAIFIAAFTGLCVIAQHGRCQSLPPAAKPAPAHAQTFEIKDGQFLLDGKPFQIISGEMHYPRIPQAYWRQRLRAAKACGLNTITTYVFWNMLEPQKGKFYFG